MMTDTKVSNASSSNVKKDGNTIVKGPAPSANNQQPTDKKNFDNGKPMGVGQAGQGGDSKFNNNNNPKKRKMHPGNSEGGYRGQGGGGQGGQGGHNRAGSGDRGDRGDRGGGDRSDGMGNGSYNGPISGHRLTGAPAWDLPPQNASAQTFTGRCRLFIANLPSSVTEESLRKLFAEFGQMSEVYIGKGNQFAFIKMDTRNNAENAKNAIDGKVLDGRTLRVRLAAHAAAIKVSNLPPSVSNELLQFAFSTFGPVERAIVVADDRGRSLNEGIVEFARKSSASAAIKKCSTESLLLSASAIPVVVTPLEARDEDEGVPEKSVLHTAEYRKEREVGPRWAEPGQIEYEICRKWKELAQIEAQRREAFDAEMRDMHENFKTQMEYYRIEETTKQLREQLRQMESQTQKFHSEREVRDDMERKREEQRRHHENLLRAQEEQLIGPYTSNQPDLNVLRRQENELRQQANVLQQMMDRQESSYRQLSGDQGGMGPHDGRMDGGNMYGQPGVGGSMMGGQGQMGPNSMQMPYGGPAQPNPSVSYHQQGPMPGGPQQQQVPLVSHHPQQHPMSQQQMGGPQSQPMPQRHPQQPPMSNQYGNGMIGPVGPPSHMMQPQSQQQLAPPQQMHPSQQQPAYMNNGGPMMGQHGNGAGSYGGLGPKRNRRY